MDEKTERLIMALQRYDRLVHDAEHAQKEQQAAALAQWPECDPISDSYCGDYQNERIVVAPNATVWRLFLSQGGVRAERIKTAIVARMGERNMTGKVVPYCCIPECAKTASWEITPLNSRPAHEVYTHACDEHLATLCDPTIDNHVAAL